MDFLYLGRSLLDTLEEMEEQRQASKENDKLQRVCIAINKIITGITLQSLLMLHILYIEEYVMRTSSELQDKFQILYTLEL